MGQVLLAKQPASESALEASLPWEGVLSLAAHWAGAGSLFDWLAPSDWQIDREWSATVVRARMTDAVLLYIQGSYIKYLPRHAGEWLDSISPHLYRLVRFSDVPTAHTDWAATLSVFGTYPSEAYVERKVVQTDDSPFTRVLSWVARNVLSSNDFVRSTFGRPSLTLQTQGQLRSALDLAEVRAAARQGIPSETDIDACKTAGGAWLILTRIAELLLGLMTGSARTQLLALRPILPTFAHQLFELGVLGLASTAVRQVRPSANWYSSTPLGAAQSGEPCLRMQTQGAVWLAHYQTVPSCYRTADSAYSNLSRQLSGGSLRPDVWILQEMNGGKLELVIECKYSIDANYVASGIPQCFAYSVEFPTPSAVRRLYITVGPDEVVLETRAWNHQFAVTNPSGLGQLVQQALQTGNIPS